VVKGADFRVAEQPRDFGNRQVFILQIASGKIHSQPVKHGGEREPLRREPALERSQAQTEPAGYFGRTRLAMRQERSNRIFYVDPECTVGRSM